MSKNKFMTVAVDFDGVIHSYTSGWLGADVIIDPPVDGAIEWLNKIVKKFNVVILTTRGNQGNANEVIMKYLIDNGYSGPELLVTNEKVASIIYIDDRGWRFTGSNFPSVNDIYKAKPWFKE